MPFLTLNFLSRDAPVLPRARQLAAQSQTYLERRQELLQHIEALGADKARAAAAVAAAQNQVRKRRGAPRSPLLARWLPSVTAGRCTCPWCGGSSIVVHMDLDGCLNRTVWWVSRMGPRHTPSAEGCTSGPCGT